MSGSHLNEIMAFFDKYCKEPAGDSRSSTNAWERSCALFSSINANTFLNRMVVYTIPERAWNWAAFRHVCADDYIHHFPEVFDLKVAGKSGTYDVVALPNWRSAPVTKTVSLDRQLGLEAGAKYVAFDFWNQELLGVVSDRLSVEVAGHDTRVVLVHRLLNHPQLIGTSRHITGAYSIQDLSWDAAGNTLRGLSEIVPGEDYTLFIHLPPGIPAAPTATAAAGGNPIPVRQERKGDLLSVSFNSPESPVAWQVKF